MSDAPAASSPVVVTRPAPGIVMLTLNRPALRNAMTGELTSAWVAALEEIGADTSVRVLVVTGAGSSFCSGADLSWLDNAEAQDRTIDRLRSTMLTFYRSWMMPRELPFPVVAAVNGPAVGAGLALAVACDIRVAGPDALFSAPFNFLGTHAGMGITALLPEVIGAARARAMLFGGREVRADEAMLWGLVTEQADDAVGCALDVATRIAAAAPIPTRLTKAALNDQGADVDAAVHWEALAQPVTLATWDLHEGIRARLAGETPNFQGR
jgi:enoyl-CoA hydratase/carnithine racemase